MFRNRVTELDIRKALTNSGWVGRSAKFEELELHAIRRPGWLQIFRFSVEAKSSENDLWVNLYGVAKDDETRIGKSKTDVQVFENESERQALLDEWSANMIQLKKTKSRPTQPTKWSRWVTLLGIVTVSLLFSLVWLGRSSASSPPILGVKNNQLMPLDDRPHGVSTTAQNAQLKMTALSFTGDLNQTRQDIIKVLSSMPRTRIVEENDRYIHAETSSFLFRFVDDLEFLLDESTQKIHFRAAARVGHSDLGVNRNRMQKIADQLESK